MQSGEGQAVGETQGALAPRAADEASQQPLISAIIPLRNRSGDRLENCLASLRWQEGVEARSVEIVISDFGSDETHQPSIDALATRYEAKVVRVNEAGLWNRSRALNIGIQGASGALLFCTDVDMIFAPNFIASILAAQEAAEGEAMVLCRCNDLPEEVPLQRWVHQDYPQLEAQSARRDTSGTGACQAAPREFFFQARGYDEKFVYWGAEDVDMTSRAERYGLTLTWLEGTTMLHQWHPTMKRDRPLRFHINRIRYKLTRHQVVKNRGGWGQQ
ncbi:MAG: glycosyltransferase [Myxococcota bacterium]|nr:glycosyltransferase [Myxococcota bacterium]